MKIERTVASASRKQPRPRAPSRTVSLAKNVDRRRAEDSSAAGAAAEGAEAAATEGESVVRYRADGGVDSEVDGAPGKDVYFMGIIDILQVRMYPRAPFW